MATAKINEFSVKLETSNLEGLIICINSVPILPNSLVLVMKSV